MAKVSSIEKNKKRQKMVKAFANKRESLKKIISNKTVSLNERFVCIMKLSSLPRNSAKCRVRNRCELTGRPRGYDRKSKLSRIAFRDLASVGMLPGVVKSSW